MSRKIDALVAEHVMGLPMLPGGKVSGYHLGLGEGEPKRYSTSIEDAWLVVEKLADLRFQIINNSNDTCAWFANSCGGWQETAPLAICLAALKAKGIALPDPD